jgi:hypothetical protein
MGLPTRKGLVTHDDSQAFRIGGQGVTAVTDRNQISIFAQTCLNLSGRKRLWYEQEM